MKTLYTKLKIKYGSLKIRNKFFLSYMVLLMLPLSFTGAYFYRYFLQTIEEQTNRFALQALEQSEMHIKLIMKEIETLGSLFSYNIYIQDMLKERFSDYEDVVDFNILQSQLELIKSNAQVYNVRLYVNDNKLYARNYVDFFPISTLADDIYFNRLITKPEYSSYWTESHPSPTDDAKEPVISYIMVIKDYSDVRKTIGCLYIDILETQVTEILDRIDFGENNQTFILNNNFEVIASTNDNREDGVLNIILQKIKGDNNQLSEGYQILEVKGEKQFVVYSQMGEHGWTLVNTVPTGEVFHETNLIAVNVLIIGFFIVLGGTIIAIWLSNIITLRIKRLTQRIRKADDFGKEIEALDVQTTAAGDEISILSENYDYMMKRIKQLIRENYEVQMARKEEEFKALQSQINPHFLYNIFDMINWMAIRIRADNISETIRMVADFYRIGLSDGREVLPLSAEIRHAELYIEIQKKRQYFECQIELPDELKNCATVKLLLQPLVENAIIHGISQVPSQTGRLIVAARQKEEEIIISVADNAGKINLEYIQAIMEKKESISGAYGLKNVDGRIKLYFGEKYGLQYRKELEKDGSIWSIAEIHIPKKEYEEHYEYKKSSEV